MSFLKRMARDLAGEVAQSASNTARNRISGRPAPQAQTPSAPPIQSRPPRPATRSEGSVLEGAFAGLIGSAERLIDNASNWIGICPKCQIAAPANTPCETCGTFVPPSATQNPNGREANAGGGAAQSGPRNCTNCGASMRGNICEYCAI